MNPLTHTKQPVSAQPGGRRPFPQESGKVGKWESGKRGPAILVPKPKALIDWAEWQWRELREGGCLQRYLARERATSVRRQRAVARRMQGHAPNPKSELQFVSALPAREWFRWYQEDKNFFLDDSNLRSLKRDNPDLPIYVPPVRLSRHNFRKAYPASSPSPVVSSQGHESSLLTTDH